MLIAMLFFIIGNGNPNSQLNPNTTKAARRLNKSEPELQSLCFSSPRNERLEEEHSTTSCYYGCASCGTACVEYGLPYYCCYGTNCCCYAKSGPCNTVAQCPSNACGFTNLHQESESSNYCMCSEQQLNFCHQMDPDSGCDCAQCDANENCVSYICTWQFKK